MKTIKFFALFTWLSSMVTMASAQQIPMYGTYMLNEFSINPAYAGEDGGVNLFGTVRDQYSGFEGSPVTEMLTVDGYLEKQKIGFGLKVYNEQTDILRNTGFALTYAYRVKLSNRSALRFGVSGTSGQRSIDFEKVFVTDENEQIIFDNRVSKFLFDANAGLLFNYADFKLGLTVPQVFGSKWNYEEDALNTQARYQNERHILTTIQYPFTLKPDKLLLEPLFLFRGAPGLPAQFDANLVLKKPNSWYATAGYRDQYAVTAGGGVILSDKLMIGYSYDYPTNEIADFSNGSHEITVGLRIGGGNAAKKGLEDAGGNAKSYERLEEQANESKELKANQAQLEKDLEQLKEMNEKQREELEFFKEKLNNYDEELDSLKTKYTKRPDEKGSDLGITPEPVDVKEGNFVVVVGSFQYLKNAIKYQQFLARVGTINRTMITQSASKNWYFVYTNEHDNLNEARNTLKSLPREVMIPKMKPWIYRMGD